ncbi:MAG: hypothetical protein EXQ61_02525 [Ilumatobacteraceae bacterium]|nr:hypothetical protein [Ilumatobacteraceae bacterium]
MTSTMPTEIAADVAASRHRVRRTFATITGGLGVVFLGLGLIALVLMSFVSSPDAAKSTVKSALAQPDVRDVIADKLIEKLQDSADTATEKLVFSIARPLIVAAVREKLADSDLIDFAGDVAATVYAVYIENAPAASVDISKFSDATLAAIRAADPSIPIDQNPTMDPLKVERKPGDTDIKAIRDMAQQGSWLFVILGILLQVAAWFLSVATQWQRVLRLGIRLFAGGVIFLGIVLIARSRIPQSSIDNKAALEAAAQFITDPMVTQFVVLIVLGAVVGATGYVLNRKVTPKIS